MNPIQITTFYRFIPFSEAQIRNLEAELNATARTVNLRGLILIGREGLNATVSGDRLAIESCKATVRTFLATDAIHFKDSHGPKHPFNYFKVKVKNEIVSLGKPDLVPTLSLNDHLTPQEWQVAIHDPETIVLDTRNDYEVEIGRFKNSVDFQLAEFNEFPGKLKAAELDKNKRVLMYCTGGIRCEKAILEMREQGFANVHQLDGGILNYLKEFPDSAFDGECFVFDYRVAVDQQLNPTLKYSLCPHCGQPANLSICCSQCGRSETLCYKCTEQGVKTCSKNCAHHHAIGSNSSKPHLPELKKRNRV